MTEKQSESSRMLDSISENNGLSLISDRTKTSTVLAYQLED